MRLKAQKLLARLEVLLPKYAWVPVAAVVVYNCLVYFVTSWVVDLSRCHTIYTPLDHQIPFVPFFSMFYILAFAHWAVSWILIGRENKQFCYRYANANIIAKTICLAVFIVYPTVMQRPSVVSNDIFSFIVKVMYFFDDKAVNCLPSIHVLASWMAMRAALQMKKVPKAYKIASIVLCLGCILAVVFIKQHYVLDIPAGILVTEIGLFATRKAKNERFLWLR